MASTLLERGKNLPRQMQQLRSVKFQMVCSLIFFLFIFDTCSIDTFIFLILKVMQKIRFDISAIGNCLVNVIHRTQAFKVFLTR